MQRVDTRGKVIGFSVMGVSRFKKTKPLQAELAAAGCRTRAGGIGKPDFQKVRFRVVPELPRWRIMKKSEFKAAVGGVYARRCAPWNAFQNSHGVARKSVSRSQWVAVIPQLHPPPATGRVALILAAFSAGISSAAFINTKPQLFSGCIKPRVAPHHPVKCDR